MDDLDDEALRDRLDAALGKAEDGGRAVRTLDAMLGEPQVLIPVEEFGEVLYAIIKEDTVVTVLPRGHGEEILQRGQALQAKVATGEVQMPERERVDERWETRRPRWRREAPGPVVIERPRLVRDEDMIPPAPSSAASQGGLLGSTSGLSSSSPAPISAPLPRAAGMGGMSGRDGWLDHAPTPERPSDPVGAALWDALERGSRRAAVAALHELLDRKERDEDLLPVWNEIAALGIPQGLKLGDLIDACALSKQSAF
jgi:hypothetical protein